jgi:adenylate kinase
VKYRKPLKDGVCDICGQKLAQREDDTEMKVLLRLDKYRSETQAVIPFYEGKGLVRRVDGGKPADEVYAAIRAALGKR